MPHSITKLQQEWTSTNIRTVLLQLSCSRIFKHNASVAWELENPPTCTTESSLLFSAEDDVMVESSEDLLLLSDLQIRAILGDIKGFFSTANVCIKQAGLANWGGDRFPSQFPEEQTLTGESSSLNTFPPEPVDSIRTSVYLVWQLKRKDAREQIKGRVCDFRLIACTTFIIYCPWSPFSIHSHAQDMLEWCRVNWSGPLCFQFKEWKLCLNNSHTEFDKDCIGLESLTLPIIPKTDIGCNTLVTATCFHATKASRLILLSTEPSTTKQTPSIEENNII